jgi:hypothetical protein
LFLGFHRWFPLGNEQARQIHCRVAGRSPPEGVVVPRRGLARPGAAWRGKGGHMMVFVGDKLTTVPSRDIDPKTARKIRKQLGLVD